MKKITWFGMAACAAGFIGSACAATYTWAPTTGGDLGDAANWGGTLPGISDTINFTKALTGPLTTTSNLLFGVTSFKANSLDLSLGAELSLLCYGAVRFEVGCEVTLSSGTLGTPDNQSTWYNFYVGDFNPSNCLTVTGPGARLKAGNQNSGFVLGQNHGYNLCIVTNGATLDATFDVGNNGGSNILSVTGEGSRLISTNANRYPTVGNAKAGGNRLVIADSGLFTNSTQFFYIGGESSGLFSDSNEVVVCNGGQAFLSTVVVGRTSHSNLLSVLAGGSVAVSTLRIAQATTNRTDFAGAGNRVIVSGDDAVLAVSGSCLIGLSSGGNRLDVEDGGTFWATNLYVGTHIRYQDAVSIPSDTFGNVFRVGDGGRANVNSITLGSTEFNDAACSNRIEIAPNGVMTFAAAGGFFRIGDNTNGFGNEVLVSGVLSNTPSSTGSLVIGRFGPANRFMVDGEGFVSITNFGLTVGEGELACGNVMEIRPGGTVLCQGAAFGGNGCQCRLEMDGGTLISGNNVVVGQSAGGSNCVMRLVNGSTLLVTNNMLYVSDAGPGSLLMVSNSTVSAKNMTVGNQYKTTSKACELSIGGTNTVITVKEDFNVSHDSALDFGIPAKGFASVPIVCAKATFGTGTVCRVAADVSFAAAGGGRVVLLKVTGSTSLSLDNVSFVLSDGMTLDNTAKEIAVRVASKAGTVVTLGN